jgi:predicted Rossmann fold flavoprotein
LRIDLKPALSESQLDQRIQRDFGQVQRKQFKNSLGRLLPKNLIPVIVALSGIDPEKPVHQITRSERLNLVTLLKRLELSIIETLPLQAAIVTAGGVCVKEIDPKTMQSRLVKGLFFAGEVIDVDGVTGGFNLQAAFSTGRLAGISAVEGN